MKHRPTLTLYGVQIQGVTIKPAGRVFELAFRTTVPLLDDQLMDMARSLAALSNMGAADMTLRSDQLQFDDLAKEPTK